MLLCLDCDFFVEKFFTFFENIFLITFLLHIHKIVKKLLKIAIQMRRKYYGPSKCSFVCLSWSVQQTREMSQEEVVVFVTWGSDEDTEGGQLPHNAVHRQMQQTIIGSPVFTLEF